MSSAGRLCIFNHQQFGDHRRIGSEVDVNALQLTFGKYNVRSKVFNNFTKAQVQTEMLKIASKDYSKKSCIVIAILSHGERNDSILGCGRNLNTDEKLGHSEFYSIQDVIIDPLIRNPTLKSKPKFIIVQACKGGNEISHFQDAVDSADIPPPPNLSNITGIGYPDELYRFYSTTETFVAYRAEEGSTFIQTFCEVLDELGEENDIDLIMTYTYYRVKEVSGGTQLPSKTCTGATKYIFGQHVNG